MIKPGSRVRIVSPANCLPQTLVGFQNRIGLLVQWEEEMAVVRFGDCLVIVAASHLESCPEPTKSPCSAGVSA